MNISLTIVVILILSPIFFGLYKTWQTQNSPNQKLFLSGKISNPKPDGPYKGSVNFKTSWQGKKFDASSSSGINLIDGKESYPFKTYTGKGLQDKNLDVFKIDYNIVQNPFWLRFILDEIVEVSPDKFLGKVHLKLIPALPFSVGYFRLEK